jgi:hypothetical protein
VQEFCYSKVNSRMVKSLVAVGIFMLLGASVMAFPSFAPQVDAGEIALAKQDRLQLKASANCSSQVWPNFDASCLRDTSSNAKVLEARLVTTSH